MVEKNQQHSVKLNNGHLMPLSGFGTYNNNFAYEDLHQALKNAIKIGYRHIDTAILYKNHKIIGDCLEECFKEGIVKREDLFITSKILNDGTDHIDEVKNVILKELKIEYLDLLLIHWPVGKKPLFYLWKELEECVKQGLTKSIGVSNFNVQLILDLLTYAEIKPAVNEFEYTPYLQQTALREFCIKKNISVISYSPLAKGEQKRKMGDFVFDIFSEEILINLSKKYNKTIAQIVLNWQLIYLKNCVIPKSFNTERMKENFESKNFIMSEEDYKQIEKMNKNIRVINPVNYQWTNQEPIFN